MYTFVSFLCDSFDHWFWKRTVHFGFYHHIRLTITREYIIYLLKSITVLCAVLVKRIGCFSWCAFYTILLYRCYLLSLLVLHRFTTRDILGTKPHYIFWLWKRFLLHTHLNVNKLLWLQRETVDFDFLRILQQ